MKIGVYKIVNPNGRVYVGSSKNIEKRWELYKKLKCKSQRRLYNSFIKYGIENHKFSILIECCVNEMLEYEHLYGLHYNVLGRKGLNCELPRFKDNKQLFSDETRQKMREAKQGIKLSEESILKRTIKQKGLKRKESTKLKMRKKKSTNHRENISIGKSKLVLNIETGIFYHGTRMAAMSTNHLKKDTLKAQLNGRNKNRTKFIYA